jgi:hypothetical protein
VGEQRSGAVVEDAAGVVAGGNQSAAGRAGRRRRLEDESGKTKVTVWKASEAPWMEEGERVVLREVSKSWYEGRVSVALTGRSSVSFPERGAWWAA